MVDFEISGGGCNYTYSNGKLTIKPEDLLTEDIIMFSERNLIKELHIIGTNASKIHTLPDNFAKTFPDLERFFCSSQEFHSLPRVIGECSRLKILGLKFCGIHIVPEGSLPESLEWLILTGNHIESLPNSIGKLSRLRKLALAGNNLSSLPESMRNCTELELLRISANNFTEVPPDWLSQLPRLAWYSEAGNPFDSKKEEDSGIQNIATSDLQIGKEINRSGSSTVYRGSYNNKPVVLKVFLTSTLGKTLGSDGYAEDDFYFSSLFGGRKQSGFIPLVGYSRHIDGRPILVMKDLGEKSKKIGDVPNFSTITRDSFDVQPRNIDIETIFGIIKSIATSLGEMHDTGVIHGDIYPHNILFDGETVYLTDFGAASVKRGNNYKSDVLAFGYLIEDLLDNRVDTNLIALDQFMGILLVLRKIQRLCTIKNPEKRPNIRDILSQIKSLE